MEGKQGKRTCILVDLDRGRVGFKANDLAHELVVANTNL